MDFDFFIFNSDHAEGADFLAKLAALAFFKVDNHKKAP
jgi:hypothetical protein